MRLGILLLIGTVIFYSCEPCEIIRNDLGIIELSSVGRAFLPYEGTETLVFVDSIKNEFRLFGNGLNQIFEAKEGFNCWTILNGEEGNVDFFDGEVLELTFSDNQMGDSAINIELRLEVETHKTRFRDDPYTLFDQFTCRFTNSNHFLRVNYPIIIRNDSDTNKRAMTLGKVSNIRDKELLGKKFESVWSLGLGSNFVYYTQQEGIIAFNDNLGTFWVLDRIE